MRGLCPALFSFVEVAMWNEGRHIILLTHLLNDQQQAECGCGEFDWVGPERLIRAMITAHRMEEFPMVRKGFEDAYIG